MENLTNKSKQKNKKSFERFVNLDVYSYTKPNDKKIFLGIKPETMNFPNAGSEKNEIGKKPQPTTSVDQSALQYYLILALQDFHENFYKPLVEENQKLKECLARTKKKNDERFEYLLKKIK